MKGTFTNYEYASKWEAWFFSDELYNALDEAVGKARRRDKIGYEDRPVIWDDIILLAAEALKE